MERPDLHFERYRRSERGCAVVVMVVFTAPMILILLLVPNEVPQPVLGTSVAVLAIGALYFLSSMQRTTVLSRSSQCLLVRDYALWWLAYRRRVIPFSDVNQIHCINRHDPSCGDHGGLGHFLQVYLETRSFGSIEIIRCVRDADHGECRQDAQRIAKAISVDWCES